MSVSVVPRQPNIRCYECGSPDVAMVCHHCGRPICTSHAPVKPGPSPGLGNPEFDKLGLERTPIGTKGVHCADCRHAVRNYMRLLVGPAITLAIVGLGLLYFRPTVIGTMLLLLGIGLAVLGYWLHQARYVTVLKRKRPPVPVVPRCKKVNIRETITGRIKLDADGRYTTEVTRQRGELTLTLDFKPADRQRCDTYRRRYGPSTNSGDVRFHAGFVVLRGAADMTFSGGCDNWVAGGHVLALTGDVADHPFLRGEMAPERNQWPVRCTYEIPPKHKGHGNHAPRLPLRLIPSLVPETAGQELVLELHWVPSFFGSAGVYLDRIDTLELEVPRALGKVGVLLPSVRTDPPATPSPMRIAAPDQNIRWKKVRVTENDGDARRKDFRVRFPIQVDPETRLRGSAQVRFNGSLSGLKGVELYDPLGRPRPDVKANIKTLVKVEFDLDLATLRYQASILKKEEIVREGVSPDHVLVTRLIDKISQQGLYVKQVIEHPAHLSRDGTRVLNRFWDLAGRKHDGVCPIDFHLVLTGEEVYGAKGHPQSGDTRIEVTVQGTATDDQMKAQIGNLRDRLVRLIEDTLEEMPVREAPPSPPTGPMAEEPQSDDAEDAEQAQTLLERLDKLETALIERHISEATYHDLREKYERGLDALQGKLKTGR